MSAERRARFAELHAREGIFVMPNPWDVGSAKLLASCGAEALATTSAGFAWALGRLDGRVARDELVQHVGQVAAATELPLNVDSERCFPDDSGGVAGTVRLLGEAGAAGCSIEDWNPVAGRIEDVGLAVERVAEAAEAAHAFDPPMVLTGRAENHLRGVDDLADTIARLVAYRDAGADCLYAPWLLTIEQVSAVVEAVAGARERARRTGGPACPGARPVGVRRVSTGSLLASAAYGALLVGARELLSDGTSEYARSAMTPAERDAALG